MHRRAPLRARAGDRVMALADADADAMTLYEVLGVDASASAQEIKTAYRKIALRSHPDRIARDGSLSEREKALKRDAFERAQRAHETLVDDVARARYDARCELNGSKRDDVLVNVTFAECATGATKLAMVPYKLVCGVCNGVGMACPMCSACGGSGCASCGSKGFGAAETCRKCGGDGVRDDFFHGRVMIPPGVENGARLPIIGRSQHVRVRILPSKTFSRDGLNVTSTLRLTAAEAREGGFFEVETVHGKETTYFDEETKSGDTKSLAGKGITQGKKTGDHVVVVEVEREPSPEPEIREHEDDEREVEDDEPATKRQKESDESADGSEPASAPELSDLERLLAEKKAKLLAQLEAAASKPTS